MPRDRLPGGLGSANGATLNGCRITCAVAVPAGERVSFGAMTFVVSADGT